MVLNDFVMHANYVFKTEQKGLKCIDLGDGFVVRVERREIGNEVELTNNKSKERLFKSLDSVFNTIEKAGYTGILKVGINHEW